MHWQFHVLLCKEAVITTGLGSSLSSFIFHGSTSSQVLTLYLSTLTLGDTPSSPININYPHVDYPKFIFPDQLSPLNSRLVFPVGSLLPHLDIHIYENRKFSFTCLKLNTHCDPSKSPSY